MVLRKYILISMAENEPKCINEKRVRSITKTRLSNIKVPIRKEKHKVIEMIFDISLGMKINFVRILVH